MRETNICPGSSRLSLKAVREDYRLAERASRGLGAKLWQADDKTRWLLRRISYTVNTLVGSVFITRIAAAFLPLLGSGLKLRQALTMCFKRRNKTVK